jgi:hypothetical protein
VDYGTTTAYGASTTLDGTLVSNHSQALSGLSPSTVYHYRVRSTDAAGNTAVSGDATFATAAGDPPPPAAGPSDTFDSGVLDPAKWVVSSSGSAAGVVSQELQITHPAGAWTKATVTSAAPHDQTGRALQLQLKRAANGGQGGSTYGETSIFLSVDATRYLELFVAGGSVTAWVNKGAGDVNLTPAWPRYDATAMQWLRFRESGGTVFFEYAAGATSPGTWTTLASVAKPFPLDAVRLQLAAGSNVAATDTARCDNVLTG